MCILLICVFKLPKLLKTQLHSVQLYVGPFFTFNKTKKKLSQFSLHLPNITFFIIYKHAVGLWELDQFIFPSYWYPLMESVWCLSDIKSTVIYVHDCHLLLLLLNAGKHQKAKQMSSRKEASDFSLVTISYHDTLRTKPKCNFIN